LTIHQLITNIYASIIKHNELKITVLYTDINKIIILIIVIIILMRLIVTTASVLILTSVIADIRRHSIQHDGNDSIATYARD